jgi:UDP-N-acetyl-2-amino-2-deoxyglucuronate dehydrogenase
MTGGITAEPSSGPRGPRPLAVVIVGAGVIGANHAAAILRHPRLRITGLVDPDDVARRDLAGWVGRQAPVEPPARYASLGAALADRRADLVVICTPTGLHAEQAEQGLAAGAHVLVEKPLDVSLGRTRRLAEAAADAASRGLVTSVVSQHRFDPAAVAVAQAISVGRLGRITSAVASVPWWRTQGYYNSAAWRGTRSLDGGGALLNQGVHTVDLLVWLLGRPVEVCAHVGRLAHRDIEVEDVVVAHLRFQTGALAVLHATTAAYPGLGVRLSVHGSRGSAVIHDDQLEYFHAADGAADAASANQAAELLPPGEVYGAAKPADAFVLGHLRQYHDVVDAIDRGRSPAVGVPDAMLALGVVEAVYRSADLGRSVLVDDVLDGAVEEPVAAAPRGGEVR